jgi:hypothetical protein
VCTALQGLSGLKVRVKLISASHSLLAKGRRVFKKQIISASQRTTRHCLLAERERGYVDVSLCHSSTAFLVSGTNTSEFIKN